jgi:uncharacterized protein (TIGR02001 family)
MTKFTKSIIAGSILGSAMMAGPAMAELSGNAAVSNNYLWRGVTQTNDMPAVSGGVDYAHDSGFYAGTWISNVDFADPAGAPASQSEIEQDIYFGFGGSAGDIGYDIGYIMYAYPLADDANFGEVALGLSYDIVSVNFAYTANSDVEAGAFVEGDMYYSASVDLPLADNGLGLGLTYGHYEFDEADAYDHYAVYLSKDDFSFGVEANDMDGEFPTGKDAADPRVVVSWGKSFSLL